MPDRYGPWRRVYALFACWQLLGVWEQIEQALIQQADAAGKVGWDVSVDSTTARAHVHARALDVTAATVTSANRQTTRWGVPAAAGRRRSPGL